MRWRLNLGRLMTILFDIIVTYIRPGFHQSVWRPACMHALHDLCRFINKRSKQRVVVITLRQLLLIKTGTFNGNNRGLLHAVFVSLVVNHMGNPQHMVSDIFYCVVGYQSSLRWRQIPYSKPR